MGRKIELHPDQWKVRYLYRDLKALTSILDEAYNVLPFRQQKSQMYVDKLNVKFLKVPLSHHSHKAEKVLEGLVEEVKDILEKEEMVKKRYKGAVEPNKWMYEIKRLARLMYEIDFEDLPFYLNYKSLIAKNVVMWRLKIGK